MKESPTSPPIYAQIALDVATRIARGELPEKAKLFGRSVMSSEYGVSPETIRRAMRLLEDMQVVEVRENSGIYIQSAEYARMYVERFGRNAGLRDTQVRLQALLEEAEHNHRQVMDTAGTLVRMSERFSNASPFKHYEEVVPAHCAHIGKTLGELHFWQETGATVIARRRDGLLVLSPGPYANLQPGDTLLFVGDLACAQAVHDFLNRT
jgi:K+/H+ antiporter YhaU regulatory subunit KhtT